MYDGAIAMNTAAWRRVTNQAGQAFDNLPAWLASSASSVKVALDKVGERWLIPDFTPV
jgi:hypothetical protein